MRLDRVNSVAIPEEARRKGSRYIDSRTDEASIAGGPCRTILKEWWTEEDNVQMISLESMSNVKP